MLDILVPLDGSALAERVLPLAATLARATGGRLRLLKAVSFPTVRDLIGRADEVQSAASDYLKDQAEQAQRAYGLPAATLSQFGPASAIIVREVAGGGVRYVAMSTHARHGFSRAVLGSVAEHVLRESPVPVFLLPVAAGDKDLTAIKRMLIPLDGSRLSEAVLEPAAVLARQLGAAITLLRVDQPPEGPVSTEHGVMVRSIDQEVDRMVFETEQYMAPLVRKLQALGIQANATEEIGCEPASHILDLATRADADLIVMATHGRSGLDRLRHGSVTEQVLRHSHVPLLAFGRIPLHELVPAEAPVVEMLTGVAGSLVAGA